MNRMFLQAPLQPRDWPKLPCEFAANPYRFRRSIHEQNVHVDQIREKTHANHDPERTSIGEESPLTDIDSNTFTPTDTDPIQTSTTEQREEVVSANTSNTSDSNSNSSVDNTNNSDGFANASGADTNASPVAEQPPQTRYPSRNRKPPTRLGFDQ